MFKIIARELRDWREWLKVIGYLIIIALGVAALVMFWFGLMVICLVFFGILLLGWACGVKITLTNKKSGRIGYLRWFTIHKY